MDASVEMINMFSCMNWKENLIIGSCIVLVVVVVLLLVIKFIK